MQGPDGSAPPLPVYTLGKYETVGLILVAEQQIFAALFAPKSEPTCPVSSHWVRIAPDGSAFAERGDAATCSPIVGAPPAMLGDSLYWFDYDSSDVPTTTLVSIPKYGDSPTTARRAALLKGHTYVDLISAGGELFAIDTGTAAANYTDGAMVGISVFGGAVYEVQDQTRPQALTALNVDHQTILIWTTLEDCAPDGICRSLVYHRMSLQDGVHVLLEKRPASRGYPITAQDGNALYFEPPSSVRQLSSDGVDTLFADGVNGMPADVVNIRLLRDEILAMGGSTDAPQLLAWPRAFAEAAPESRAFGTDDQFVYVQRGGAIVRLAAP